MADDIVQVVVADGGAGKSQMWKRTQGRWMWGAAENVT